MLEPIIIALRIYSWIIIARAIVSWLPNIPRNHPVVVVLSQITDPVLVPMRKILPPEKTGYIDLSPLIAYFIIRAITVILQQQAIG